ncbi:MAG: DUF2892 domain-containing protein [Parachlamydiaceae bacterium]|nr:DUF2892 domain-containing protein [Parachlamydiaceae bacterium]
MIDNVKKNIGTYDRLFRFTLAVILLFFSWWYASWIVLGFGLFTLYEALASWCVVYHLLGKNSCPISKK